MADSLEERSLREAQSALFDLERGFSKGAEATKAMTIVLRYLCERSAKISKDFDIVVNRLDVLSRQIDNLYRSRK